VAGVGILDAVPLRDTVPLAVLALAEVRFPGGTHEIYQLVLGFRPDDHGWGEHVIAHADGWTVYDALFDPELAREVVQLMRRKATLEVGDALLEFCTPEGETELDEPGEPRPVGAEQSNSSVVFGDHLILKAYRKLDAGINPELELLRFLSERGFPNIAPLHGWVAYSGRVMPSATLGILQSFVHGRSDGWAFALESLRDEPDEFLAHARRLGEVTGAMHAYLASDPDDPDFAPEEPSAESLALLTASVEEEIEQVFLDLPQDNELLDPIRGRGQEVSDQLRLLTSIGQVGRVIRHHGDYHLAQVLWTGEDWIVLDFEGEPARSIAERRRKRAPLRDVAGMLRSFAYVASASELQNGVPPPPGWETAVREQFMDGYIAEVDPILLPSGQGAIERLLAVFELEKAIYELRYELDNRPDWVKIPVAGIERLLAVTA
jgi:trehalose synthase-fused probable maltokinase